MLSKYVSSIAGRLVLGFGCLLVMMAAVSVVSGWSLIRAGAQVRQIVEVNERRVADARGLLDSINLMTTQVRSIVLLADTAALKAESAILEKAHATYIDSAKSLDLSLAGAPADEQLLAKEIQSLAEKGVATIQLAAKQGVDGANIDATTTLTQLLPPVEAAWRGKVHDLIALESTRNSEMSAAIGVQTQRATFVSSALALTALFAGVVIAWLIARGIQRPIEGAVQVAERIAEGALDNPVGYGGTVEVRRLLDAIRTMQERLRELVCEIRDTAGSIQTASAEVAAGNVDLSQRTEQAASKLQSAASSMEQLTENLRHGAEAAAQANSLAGSAAVVAKRGGTVVSEVVTTMEQISGSSKRISDIISVIDGIAFQTNILALNAAVEAARAGESGRGFAVVAGEVRALAQRSATAAREINELIRTSISHVDTGTRLVADAGGAMGEIVTSAQHVSDIIGDVTAAYREQSGRIDEINATVNELDNATQQNAAMVEQGTAAAESLRDQAERLARLVATFNLGADPSTAREPKEAEPANVAEDHRDPPAVAPTITLVKRRKAVPLIGTPAQVPTQVPASSTAAAATVGEWQAF